MRKTCKKRKKKDPYNGSIARQRYRQLIFKARIFFLLVAYIRFLTFTINI